MLRALSIYVTGGKSGPLIAFATSTTRKIPPSGKDRIFVSPKLTGIDLSDTLLAVANEAEGSMAVIDLKRISPAGLLGLRRWFLGLL